jgi:hypothetical protein
MKTKKTEHTLELQVPLFPFNFNVWWFKPLFIAFLVGDLTLFVLGIWKAIELVMGLK